MICKRHILCTLAVVFGAAGGYAQTDLFPQFDGSVTSVAMTHTGDKVVFIGEKGEGKAVFESAKKGDGWDEPKTILALTEMLTKSNNRMGGFSFNHDGTKLLFHAKIDTSYDILYAELKGGEWGAITKFAKPVNSNEDEFSPSLSVDNNTIFFLRPKQIQNSKDDVCKQIVKYTRGNDGSWNGPNYLPRILNEGCQETPFFCADEKTLFFSSKRIDTTPQGKKLPDDIFNLYYTQNIFDEGWTLPKYIPELSTEYNDFSPQMTTDGAVFIKNTSPKKANKKHPNKTYSYEAPSHLKPSPTMQLVGTIKDLDTGEPTKAQIIVSDMITSAILGDYTTNEKGEYSIYLGENGNYKIDFFKNGYSHSYHYEKTDYFTENIKKQFDTTIFSKVQFDLNVFDEETYFPLSPKISIFDSTTNELLIDSLLPIEKGKYKSQLNIGKTYKVHIDCQYFNPHDIYLNTIADIFYNEFEEDVELTPAKTTMILDIEAGEESDSVLVKVKNLSRNETRTVVAKRDKDGNLIVELREGDSYEIDVAKKGYTFSSTKVDVGKSKKTQKLNIKLDLLTKDTKMTFNNITFEVNSAELNTASFTELNRIIEFLQLNDNVKIELSAHTDDLGSDWYNLRLSEKRAQSAAKYLIDKGIKEEQIVAKGYGETTPVVPNTSDENRAQNRRVEIKIIE